MDTWAHGDHTITVNENGDFVSDDLTASTLQEIREKIDSRDRRNETAKRRKLSLAVYSAEDGAETITGVNPATGVFNGTKNRSKYGGVPAYYVDAPRVRELITKQSRLKKELEAVQTALWTYKIEAPSNFEIPTPEKYEQALTRLEETHAKKLALALSQEAGQ